jgi:hypothetical protein
VTTELLFTPITNSNHTTHITITNDPVTYGIDENVLLEAARDAWGSLKNTFEHWISIGHALKILRDKADRLGGRWSFQKLREQQGLGELDKGTITRLLRIMENLPKVVAWRETLTGKQQVEWSSPSAVFKHCPLFKPPKPESERPPLQCRR